jgi:purine catabolism regulator
MLTVRSLIAEFDVRLLAGEAGLDLPVRWVHISELLDPTPWLSGGELLLTTGMQLETPERQREFVVRLAEHQLAGLGFGTGFAHDRVPQALLDAAEERSFPVFEVPYELPFIALTEAAFTQLASEQHALLRRALAAHERLERIVLSERGLPALAGGLATLVGAAVAVFDRRGELLVRHAFRREPAADELAALGRELRERARRRQVRQFAPGGDVRALALPVAADGAPRTVAAEGEPMPQAWLVAIKDAGPLGEFDRLVLRQAVTIVALELLRRRIAGDTERRLAGDVLAALLGGELKGEELRRRLEPFGLSGRVAALVLARPQGNRGAAEASEAALRAALRSEGTDALVAAHGVLMCALIEGEESEQELFELARRVAEQLSRELGVPVTIGAGRAVDAADARRTFHEARCALEAVSLGARSTGQPEGAHAAAAGMGNGAQAGASGAQVRTGNGMQAAVSGAQMRAGNGAQAAVSGAHAGVGNGGQARLRGGPPARPPALSAARVATYRDLGAFQLLLALQGDEALRLYCDSILGPIEASEGPYGGELMRSLEAFIEENGQWERAARRLYCHRHTLRYRIRRIEELTGRNLSGARDRIEFWLAIRGRELVS